MKVLFICKSNAGRSVIADAFFNKLSKKNSASSAGTAVKKEGKQGNPANPKILKILEKIDIDASKHKRRQLTYELFKKADMVVVLLTKPERKTLPKYITNSKNVAYWNVLDIKGTSHSFHIKSRSKIGGLVSELVKKTG